MFQSEAPILPASMSRYPLVTQLPGSSFDDSKNVKQRIEYDSNGNLMLDGGDYTIPVMTYCMNSEGSSPSAHIYALSRMQGRRAQMIRDLNLRAQNQFSTHDIQILSWSLQNGLSYSELTEQSQKIINIILPEYKDQIQESFLSQLEKKWDQASESSKGTLPSFGILSEKMLDNLGEVGQQISKIKRFRNLLKQVGNDYSALSQFIETSSNGKQKIENTKWSQISSRVYARFITQGHYQEIGYLQIRVLTDNQVRSVSTSSKVTLDINSLLADPQQLGIQPLSFSAIYGYGGVIALPILAEAPLAAVLVLGAILYAQVVNWDDFFKVRDVLNNSKNPEIKKALDQGNELLSKAHDELEKPAKDAGIISGKTNNTSTGKDKNVREYQKQGGEEQLQKDFDKIPGELSKTKDGHEMKTLPNGSKVVKRPAMDDKFPTLEIQPRPIGDKLNDKLRVKIRYK